MSETQVLLSRIAALRRQLEQVQRLSKDAGTVAAPLLNQDSGQEESVRRLERQVLQGSQQTVILDTVLRQLTPDFPAKDLPTLPKHLAFRARRLLERGRQLVSDLRSLAEKLEPSPASRAQPTASQPDPPLQECKDPLVHRYRETAAMANTALRMIQAFPDSTGAQLALCQGLEAILDVVAQRIAGITTLLGRRRRESDQVELLAGLLTALNGKESVNVEPFVSLAEQLLAEAQQAAPLRFLVASAEQPAQFVASHSLTVAQVVARVVRQDSDFRNDPRAPVLAALLHDAGMLAVPPSILVQPGPLDDAQRRALEAHTRLGAELMSRLVPTGSWLAEVAAGHHERLDGTGYPSGRQEGQLDSLTRLVAVCDVYAALCTDRPHRAALDPRTALTDTLLLAEQGTLDRYHAERLLRLSFYPVGSIVELADGALGVVVATHTGRRDLTSPARPVLALLTDTQGQRLAVSQYLDLAECENRSIVRTISKAERSTLLGSRYAELL